MLTIILDTNVLLDASSDDYSAAKRIIEEILAGHFRAVASTGTRREYQLLVRRKVKNVEDRSLLLDYLDRLEEIEHVPKISVVLEDPDDVKFLALAKQGNADYLITSDQVLLRLEKFGKTRIATPLEFWNRYQDESGEGWAMWKQTWLKPKP
jgi:putative PIN family toxin of toxin-antitoxin system